LPALRRIAETDYVKCRNMWLVSDEASDAIAHLEGRPWPERIAKWDGEIEG
jgi:hypothetical protein